MGFIISCKPNAKGPKVKLKTKDGEIIISTEKVSSLLRIRVDAPKEVKIESLIKKNKQLPGQLSFEDLMEQE